MERWKKKVFFVKNVSRTSNPPDELAQNWKQKKIPFGRIVPPMFLRKFRILPCFHLSACTPLKMEDAPSLLKIPKSECPDIWIRLPKHKWPKSWSTIEEPVVPLERYLYGHPLAGLLCGDNSKKFWWKMDGRKYQTGNACLCIASKACSCLWTWMTSNWLEKSKISILCERNWWNTMIGVSRHRFLITCIFGMHSARM